MCAFSERRKKNLRPHDTIKMVCNIHNGALLLCPAKLSRHKLQAGGWRRAGARQKSAAHARERLKHGRRAPRHAARQILVPWLAAAALVALGAHARVLTSCTILLSFQTIFAMQKQLLLLHTKAAGNWLGAIGRARAASRRAMLYYSAVWCKTSASLMHFLAMPSSHHMCACIPYRVSHLKMHFPPLQAGCAVQKAATFGVHTIRIYGQACFTEDILLRCFVIHAIQEQK